MAEKKFICIVCEENIPGDNVATTMFPDENLHLVVCKACDTFTPDRSQASWHWQIRSARQRQQTQIREAARDAYNHLVYLNEHRLLTVGGLIAMEALQKALGKP